MELAFFRFFLLQRSKLQIKFVPLRMVRGEIRIDFKHSLLFRVQPKASETSWK